MAASIQHGLMTNYSHGICRCPVCRAAYNEWRREYREDKRRIVGRSMADHLVSRNFRPNSEVFDWDRTGLDDYGPAARLRMQSLRESGEKAA